MDVVLTFRITELFISSVWVLVWIWYLMFCKASFGEFTFT